MQSACAMHNRTSLEFVGCTQHTAVVMRPIAVATASRQLARKLQDGGQNLPQMFRGPEESIDQIRKYFAVHKGGAVDLECRSDGIAIVTLNNPSKKNAFSGTMMGEMLDIVDRLEQWPQGKGVLLKGANGTFCSGGDLDMERSIPDPAGVYKLCTFMDHIQTRLQGLPLISVAFLQGAAVAGGAELTLACDYRVAASSFVGIGFIHGRLGLTAAYGGARRLVSTVGYRPALDLWATARICPPKEALQMGLVDAILDDGPDVEECALKWLSGKTNLTSSVIRAAKSVCLIAREEAETSEIERRICAQSWASDERKVAYASNLKHRL